MGLVHVLHDERQLVWFIRRAMLGTAAGILKKQQKMT